MSSPLLLRNCDKACAGDIVRVAIAIRYGREERVADAIGTAALLRIEEEAYSSDFFAQTERAASDCLATPRELLRMLIRLY